MGGLDLGISVGTEAVYSVFVGVYDQNVRAPLYYNLSTSCFLCVFF